MCGARVSCALCVLLSLCLVVCSACCGICCCTLFALCVVCVSVCCLGRVCVVRYVGGV